MTNLPSAQKQFSLSVLANDIREFCPEKYGTKHDDYLCVGAFASDIGFSVAVDKMDQQLLSGLKPSIKDLLERLFETRKTLIKRHTVEADLQYSELKKCVAKLIETDPKLQQMTDLPSFEASTAFGLITGVDALRSAINGYYKLRAEEKDGKVYFEKLGEILLQGIKSLSGGEPIPVDIFCGDFMFLKEPMRNVAKLLSVASAETRGELITQLNTIFKALNAKAILPEVLFTGQLLFLKESINKLLVMIMSAEREEQEELVVRFGKITGLLLEGKPFPQSIFSEETSFLEEPLLKLSRLFMAVNPDARRELVGRFNKIMRELLACFVYYRFPVSVLRGAKPVYFARFIPAVKLLPFLEFYGLDLGSFTISP